MTEKDDKLNESLLNNRISNDWLIEKLSDEKMIKNCRTFVETGKVCRLSGCCLRSGGQPLECGMHCARVEMCLGSTKEIERLNKVEFLSK